MTIDTHSMKLDNPQAFARVAVTGFGTPACASAWSELSNVTLNLGSAWASTGYLAHIRSVRRSSDS